LFYTVVQCARIIWNESYFNKTDTSKLPSLTSFICDALRLSMNNEIVGGLLTTPLLYCWVSFNVFWNQHLSCSWKYNIFYWTGEDKIAIDTLISMCVLLYVHTILKPSYFLWRNSSAVRSGIIICSQTDVFVKYILYVHQCPWTIYWYAFYPLAIPKITCCFVCQT